MKLSKGSTSEPQFTNWMGDYPDPENFLFLLYGPNSIKLHGGVNVVNYQNKAYDRLFVKMKVTPDGPERQALIDQMRAIVYQDTPVVVSYYPTHMKLVHDWSMSAKSNALMSGYVKYYDLNPRKRWQSQNKWNKPNKTIVWSVLGVLLAGIVASLLLIRRQSRAKVMCRFDESEKGGV